MAGLVELIEQGAAEFRNGLRASLRDRRHGRFQFLQPALLHAEILLLLEQKLERFQVPQLRAELAVIERAANVDALWTTGMIASSLLMVAAVPTSSP